MKKRIKIMKKSELRKIIKEEIIKEGTFKTGI